MRVMLVNVLVSALVLDQQALDQKDHPVAKVVKLLQDMSTQLQEEKKADEEVHEKMDCWCRVNDGETTEAIAAAIKAISSLEADIEAHSAKASQLETEIANLKDEREQAKESIKTATGVREKEHEAFAAEEKELLETIAALSNAVSVLGKHHGEPAAEPASEEFLSVASALKRISSAKHTSVKKVLAFLQQPYESYNARSGEIFGILKEMKSDFEKNLSATQKEEQRAQAEFDALVAEKEKAIAKATERIVAKTEQMTAARVALEQAKADLKDTRESLSGEQKFLVDLKMRCKSSEEEYQERQTSRSEEILAIGDALKILTDDSARDLFSSTLGFVQLEDVSVRGRVVKALERAAQHSGSGALHNLADSAKLDAFTKVKAAIDEMVAQLQKDQADEVKHLDWCNGELRSAEVQTREHTNTKEDLTVTVNKLGDTIETLDGEIQALHEAVAELKRQIKRASEDREAANAAFQQAVADQRATVVVLTKALERLEQVYAAKTQRKAGAALVQRKTLLRNGDKPPPPAGFKKYEKQSAGGALGLIEQCIGDAQKLEQEALHAEQSEQTAYESFVKDSANEIADNNRSANDKTEAKATAEVEKSHAEADLRSTDEALENLAKYADGVHAACDFVLKNFDLRQQARGDEIGALQDAKAILSGADFGF